MVSLGGESLEDFAFGKISGEEKARQDPNKEVLKKSECGSEWYLHILFFVIE